MGNAARKNLVQCERRMKVITGRRNVISVLNSMPPWMFPEPKRFVLNEAVLKMKEQQKSWTNGRPSSTTVCQNSDAKIDALHAEIVELRKQLTLLLNKNAPISPTDSDENNTSKQPSVTTPPVPPPMPHITFSSKKVDAAGEAVGNSSGNVVVNIPIPPPLPQFTFSAKLEDKGEVANIDKRQTRMDGFIDLSSVKLKPVKREVDGRMRSPNRDDIRHDLYSILKKRYAASHTPVKIDRKKIIACSTSDDEAEDYDSESDEDYFCQVPPVISIKTLSVF